MDIFHQLEMITFNILAHDGTLYPTWARYKGCTYFCDQCCCITVDNVIDKVKNRILYRLNKLSEGNLGSEIRVYEDCPSDRFSDCYPRRGNTPQSKGALGIWRAPMGQSSGPSARLTGNSFMCRAVG